MSERFKKCPYCGKKIEEGQMQNHGIRKCGRALESETPPLERSGRGRVQRGRKREVK